MSERSQFRLLGERRFGPFFGVQFLGALNDNAFKQALVILLAYQTASFTTLSSDALQNLAQALFILPFLLFSATAGQLADKYEKSGLITITVAIELAVMMLGALGFFLRHIELLLLALFLGGAQSALFGPVKYAYLPQHLKDTELVGGNGVVEMGTSVAILIGMVIGGWLIAQPGWGVAGVAILTCAVSAAGIALSRFIPRSPPPEPGLKVNWNPVSETWRILRYTGENRTVFNSVLGVSWFWFYGALLVTQFPNLSKNVLIADETVVTFLLIVFSVGIGIGSLLCERMSGHKVEIGLVPFGSIGLSLFALDLGFAISLPGNHAPLSLSAFLAEPAHWRIVADLAAIGLFGGFYIVPLNALIQIRSAPSHRSRVIAGNNVLNALFMVVAAGLAVAMFAAGVTIPQLIITLAVMNAAVALYIYTLVPEFLLRFLAWILVHSVYRLKKEGLDHIPEDGPALIVCNHAAYVDSLVVTAACRRPIRWVQYYKVFHTPVLNFLFRTAGAIPIASAREDPQMLERAYESIARALEAGELVGIFPEGQVTYDGEIGEFRGGIMKMLERNPVPVVPMAVSGLWQSLFSHNRERLWHVAKLFPRLRLAVGEPLAPGAATPELLRARVLALRGDWK